MSIEVKGLTHIYSEGLPDESLALEDISFRAEDGQLVGLIGHTGSGKSTLVQHLNGLLKPKKGHIIVGDVDITAENVVMRDIRRKIGLVFQYPEYQLFEETVAKDVAFGPSNLGLTAEEVDERVREAIELVGLDYDKVKNLSPFDLSGGQKRRVALAGVIAMQPDYLILDEPLAGLDPVGKKKMLQILRALHRDAGITVVVVSHDADAVVEDAEQVLYLRDGKILEQGAPSDVFYRLWLREMEHMTRDKHSKMNGEQMRDRSTGRLSEDTLAEAICELPGCMQLLIRLRIMGLPVSCKHTQLAETVQAIVDAVGR